MVDLTSLTLFPRSSAWATGVGNFPAVDRRGKEARDREGQLELELKHRQAEEETKNERTLGKTGTEQSRDLLDEGLGGEEGLVLLSELLDELLVLVELLQVIDGHVCGNERGRRSASMNGREKGEGRLTLELDLLSSIDISGIGENADGHPGSGDVGELDGSREPTNERRKEKSELEFPFERVRTFPSTSFTFLPSLPSKAVYIYDRKLDTTYRLSR